MGSDRVSIDYDEDDEAFLLVQGDNWIALDSDEATEIVQALGLGLEALESAK